VETHELIGVRFWHRGQEREIVAFDPIAARYHFVTRSLTPGYWKAERFSERTLWRALGRLGPRARA
jgi:hypothetical protein